MALSVASILAEAALRHPQRTAVVFGPTRTSYEALWEQARRHGAHLRALGVEPGDRVALLALNTPDFCCAYYGILAIGAVVVPIHALLTAQEIAYVLSDSGAKALICADQLAAGAPAAAQAGIPLVKATLPNDDPIERMVSREEDDTAVILYTSGTTGKPKGAMLTQTNIVMNASACASDLFHMTPEDVLLAVLPLFHAFGQTVVMNGAFRAGASIVLMPRFDGAAALQVMIDERVTIFAGVPTMYMALLEAAKAIRERPQLKLCVAGGASLPVVTIDAFESVFGAKIWEGYGLSETSPVASFNQPEFGRKPGTVGCGIWGVELAIAHAEIDDRIELLPTGELGEIVIRGHCVFKGYLNNPQATSAAIVDGWCRSGDLGTQDTEGFVTIVDRKKDMIIRGGYNVYPRDVEEVLMRHPAVKQVAVVGIPHETHGEEVVAVVIRHEEQMITGDELIEWSKEHLAKYKYPRVVEFIETMPLGPSGKVLKRVLRERVHAH